MFEWFVAREIVDTPPFFRGVPLDGLGMGDFPRLQPEIWEDRFPMVGRTNVLAGEFTLEIRWL